MPTHPIPSVPSWLFVLACIAYAFGPVLTVTWITTDHLCRRWHQRRAAAKLWVATNRNERDIILRYIDQGRLRELALRRDTSTVSIVARELLRQHNHEATLMQWELERISKRHPDDKPRIRYRP